MQQQQFMNEWVRTEQVAMRDFKHATDEVDRIRALLGVAQQQLAVATARIKEVDERAIAELMRSPDDWVDALEDCIVKPTRAYTIIEHWKSVQYSKFNDAYAWTCICNSLFVILCICTYSTCIPCIIGSIMQLCVVPIVFACCVIHYVEVGFTRLGNAKHLK